MKNDPKEIILHIIDSDIPSHDNVKTINQWHLERGFNGIGYHKYVNRFGEVEEGRNVAYFGAHTKGHNFNTIGVSTFGNKDYEKTQEQYEGIVNLIIDLKQKYKGIKKVSQHSDYDKNKPHCAGYTESQMRYFNSLVI